MLAILAPGREGKKAAEFGRVATTIAHPSGVTEVFTPYGHALCEGKLYILGHSLYLTA